jgi:D-serine/D-alanine/glycine transporter
MQEETLTRGLKNRHVQLMAIGGAIGTGLFLGAGKTIQLTGPSILLAYIITGIVLFLIMRALGELLLSNLQYHSFVDFVRDYLGNMAAFITGWTYWFCWISIAMADITAVGMYTQFWFPNVSQWMPGLIALIILLVMNLATVKALPRIRGRQASPICGVMGDGFRMECMVSSFRFRWSCSPLSAWNWWD